MDSTPQNAERRVLWTGLDEISGCVCASQPYSRTAVPLWRTEYLEFDWFVPKTGLQFALFSKRGEGHVSEKIGFENPKTRGCAVLRPVRTVSRTTYGNIAGGPYYTGPTIVCKNSENM